MQIGDIVRLKFYPNRVGTIIAKKDTFIPQYQVEWTDKVSWHYETELEKIA